MCKAVIIGWDPASPRPHHPPAFGLIMYTVEGAVGQPRPKIDEISLRHPGWNGPYWLPSRGQLSSKLLTIPVAVYRKKYEEKCSFYHSSAVIDSITSRLGNISHFSLFGKIFWTDYSHATVSSLYLKMADFRTSRLIHIRAPSFFENGRKKNK